VLGIQDAGRGFHGDDGNRVGIVTGVALVALIRVVGSRS